MSDLEAALPESGGADAKSHLRGGASKKLPRSRFGGFGQCIVPDILTCTDPAFEKATAGTSCKFHLGLVAIQVLFGMLDELGAWVIPRLPHYGLSLPLAISITARLSIVGIRCCCKKFPILQAGALLMVLDIGLMASWRSDLSIKHFLDASHHPTITDAFTQALINVYDSHDANWGETLAHAALNNSTSATGQVPQGQDVAALAHTWVRLSASMVAGMQSTGCGLHLATSIYTFQLLVWYNVTFLLLLRHAIPATPVALMVAILLRITFHPKRYKERKNALIVEIASLAFSMLVALATKAWLEGSQRSSFNREQQLMKELLQERVLRTRAELSEEQLRTKVMDGFPEGTAVPSELDCPALPLLCKACKADLKPSEAGGALPAPLAPRRPSLHSAPPAMLTFLAHATAADESCRQPTGDCLPPDSLVWVEGHVLPCKVAEVSDEQSVLCYDNVSGSLKYSQVSSVRSLTGATSWVRVALVDGTALTLTADHPVQRAAPGIRSEESQVRAMDLRPGVDALTVMRLMPVQVLQVEQSPAPAPGEGHRVALAVRQPERHSVFVAAPGEKGQVSCNIAIGSADGGHTKGHVSVHRTFICIEDSEELCVRRTQSAPPSTRSGDADADERPQVTALKSEFVSDSDLSSDRTVDRASNIDFLVGPGERTPAEPFRNVASARGLLGIQQSGLKSLGSVHHSAGTCKVCVFENRHQHDGKEPCFKGKLCERCHEDHSPIMKPKKKPTNSRRWTQAIGSSSSRSGPSRGLEERLRPIKADAAATPSSKRNNNLAL